MILVVDVGNTNITCGVYEAKEMKATFRITGYRIFQISSPRSAGCILSMARSIISSVLQRKTGKR